MKTRSFFLRTSLPGLLLFTPAAILQAQAAKTIEARAKLLANECRDEVVRRIDGLIKSGKLTQAQLFDTFYIPIAGTSPQKFHTQYDRAFDEALQDVLDAFLGRDPRLVYVILADANGYVPTHNRRFSQPLTGNREYDAKNNRTKLLFNDRTGLAASRNKNPFLLQEYQRDTGETLFDLSVPLFLRDQHWGCVRIGYRKD